MAGPVPDAGVQVPCPSCGRTVYQKRMIPVLAQGGVAYICATCARELRQEDARNCPSTTLG